jgi:preprotein translocase subunit YajC
MKKELSIMVLLFIAISFTSCKKEEEKEVNKEELMQKHVWKGVEVKTYVGGTETNTVSISDLEFTFDANKDFSIAKNGNIEFSGTWEYIKGDPDILKLTKTSGVEEYSVDKITEDLFNISITNSSQETYKYFLEK